MFHSGTIQRWKWVVFRDPWPMAITLHHFNRHTGVGGPWHGGSRQPSCRFWQQKVIDKDEASSYDKRSNGASEQFFDVYLKFHATASWVNGSLAVSDPWPMWPIQKWRSTWPMTHWPISISALDWSPAGRSKSGGRATVRPMGCTLGQSKAGQLVAAEKPDHHHATQLCLGTPTWTSKSTPERNTCRRKNVGPTAAVSAIRWCS